MQTPLLRSFAAAALLAAASTCPAQVFTVGEHSATAGIKTDFPPTHVELAQKAMNERSMRDLVRNLVGEQGFAHRVLPMGPGLTLPANGNLAQTPSDYKRMIYEKGASAAEGDRVAITALLIKGEKIILDFNGGPYLKHRFLRHVSIMGAAPAMDDGKVATGSRVTLTFEGGVPEVSAADVKSLLAPIVDFGVKSTEEAYAETLPTPVRSAIASHEVLVGMNRRMVLASMGAPGNKVREEVDGIPHEEWIYGKQPQPLEFVRFTGDRVSQVKIAAPGKPVEIHDKDELAGVLPAVEERRVALADGKKPEGTVGPPSLLKEGEQPAEPVSTQRKVLVDGRDPADPRTTQPPK